MQVSQRYLSNTWNGSEIINVIVSVNIVSRQTHELIQKIEKNYFSFCTHRNLTSHIKKISTFTIALKHTHSEKWFAENVWRHFKRYISWQFQKIKWRYIDLEMKWLWDWIFFYIFFRNLKRVQQTVTITHLISCEKNLKKNIFNLKKNSFIILLSYKWKIIL